MSLYKKYRPKNLAEMKGNQALISAIKAHFSKPNHNHAILLYGASGCGKTTLARAVSKEFLGVDDTDIDEINASNTNGVDDMRKIEEAMKNLPLTSKYNVFIIDECQNLTPAAKSALLKPCEDGGDFNYVFFCTTNPDKFFKGDKGELATWGRPDMFEPISSRGMPEECRTFHEVKQFADGFFQLPDDLF